jgi:hypothetical protein
MKGHGGGDDGMFRELLLLSLLLLKSLAVAKALRDQFWLEYELLFERCSRRRRERMAWRYSSSLMVK